MTAAYLAMVLPALPLLAGLRPDPYTTRRPRHADRRRGDTR